MPPTDDEVTPQAPEVVVAAPVIPDGAPAPDASAGEQPAPEVTLESLQAERDAIATEKARIEGELESERRGNKSRDRAIERWKEENNRLASQVENEREKRDAETRRVRLEAARDDPDKADALIREDLDRINNPPTEPIEQVTARAVADANRRTHMTHRARLGITDEEGAQAFEAARRMAAMDGREAPDFTEVMHAESEIAAQRAVSTATSAELEEARRLLAEKDEELEALRAGDAGARMRAAGGPEDRVPNGGSGKTYKNVREVEEAFATGQLPGGVQELKRLRRQFEVPVRRR